MNVHQMFPSRYVTAFDLNGSDVTACIERVIMEEMKSQHGTEMKPVIHFKNAKKGMVINKTNGMTIATMYGPETDNWLGKCITLYAAEVDAFGKMQKAIRVRPTVPAAKKTGPSIEEVVKDDPPEDGPDLDDYGPEEFENQDDIPFD